jgi:tRNA1Val (adenine37-N6)-methyltransferase
MSHWDSRTRRRVARTCRRAVFVLPGLQRRRDRAFAVWYHARAVQISLSPSAVDQPSPRGGVLRAARRPAGWNADGPAPVIPQRLDDLWPGPEEDLCWLAGNWRILQRTDGQRTSLDDTLVAHLAASLVTERPPSRCLDLGCGIGSVLMFLAWRFPAARLVGIEAQEVSSSLARRSLAWNGIAGRAEIHTGDFRSDSVLASPAPFDLVTGTPPYFPIGAGPESDRVQRAPCRFEHRGGIEAYCAVALPRLAPGAPFVACAAWNQRERVEPAARAAGLRLVRWREIVPRAGKEPLLCIFAMRASQFAEPLVVEPPLVVRDGRGRRTEEFVALRGGLGMPP